jgi:hypothetical protein
MSKYLPTDPKERKQIPLYSGVMKYFPDALVAVAKVSWKGNEQHNPGEPLHWSRGKSPDHRDAAMRHLLESEQDGEECIEASAQAAWRMLAILQLEIEAKRKREDVLSFVTNQEVRLETTPVTTEFHVAWLPASNLTERNKQEEKPNARKK